MSPIVAKMLTPLISPLGLCTSLWLAGLYCYLSGRRIWGHGCTWLGIVLLLVFSSPLVGDALLGALESEFTIEAVAASPNADAIVVLGGVTVPPVPPSPPLPPPPPLLLLSPPLLSLPPLLPPPLPPPRTG